MKLKTQYKNTSIGLIPSDWKVRKLNELGVFSKGKGILKEQVISKGYPCIRYGEIYTSHSYIVNELKSFIDMTVAKESKEIKKGDILFAGSGETIEEIGKSVAYVGNERAYAGGDIIILSPDNNLNTEFLSYALESDYSKKQKRIFGQGNSVVHIYSSDLSKLRIALPPLSEQRKIANILTTWNKAIQETRLLIEKLEIRNKALAFSLFRGRLASKKSEKISLGKFLTFTPRKVEKPTENYLALGIRSHGKGIFHKPDFDPKAISMDTLYEVKENDFIVNITFAWEHAVAIISKADEAGLVSHRFPTYLINQKIVSVDFFRHLILQRFFRQMLENISPGGAGRNRVLSKKDLLKLEIPIPSLEEQHSIAEILNTADQELDQHQEKLKDLQKQKHGLMQQLLIGKVRTV